MPEYLAPGVFVEEVAKPPVPSARSLDAFDFVGRDDLQDPLSDEAWTTERVAVPELDANDHAAAGPDIRQVNHAQAFIDDTVSADIFDL